MSAIVKIIFFDWDRIYKLKFIQQTARQKKIKNFRIHIYNFLRWIAVLGTRRQILWSRPPIHPGCFDVSSFGCYPLYIGPYMNISIPVLLLWLFRSLCFSFAIIIRSHSINEFYKYKMMRGPGDKPWENVLLLFQFNSFFSRLGRFDFILMEAK